MIVTTLPGKTPHLAINSPPIAVVNAMPMMGFSVIIPPVPIPVTVPRDRVADHPCRSRASDGDARVHRLHRPPIRVIRGRATQRPHHQPEDRTPPHPSRHESKFHGRTGHPPAAQCKRSFAAGRPRIRQGETPPSADPPISPPHRSKHAMPDCAR